MSNHRLEAALLHEALLIRAAGQWIPVAWTGALTEKPHPRIAELVSLEGNRSIVTLPSRLREWSIDGDAPASWWRALDNLAAGAYGVGPHEMWHPLAARTNVVAPGAGFTGLAAGVSTAEGRDLPVAVVTAPQQTAPIPVLPGTVLEATALQQGGQLQVQFFNAAMASVGLTSTAAGSTLGRVAVTATAASTAAWARVIPSGATLAGGAQLRIAAGSDSRYYPPAGVDAVVVVAEEHSHHRVDTTRPGRTPARRSFTILEVAR